MSKKQFLVTVDVVEDAPMSTIAQFVRDAIYAQAATYGAPYKRGLTDITVDPTEATKACTCDEHTPECTVDVCRCDNKALCPVHTLQGHYSRVEGFETGFRGFLHGHLRVAPIERNRVFQQAYLDGWDTAEHIKRTSDGE